MSLDHPDVLRLRMRFEHLKGTAVNEAKGFVHRNTKMKDPIRFAPSRLHRCPRDRNLINGMFIASYMPAIAKRLPQLNRLDETLWRICPDWPRHTREELCAVPADILAQITQFGS